MKWTHLDLFSGIGGASYAADQVWGKENINHIFCDNEPFAQTILKKHWPAAKIYGDIRTLTADAYYGKQSEQHGRSAAHGKGTPESRRSTWASPSARNSGRGSTEGVRLERTDSPFLLTGGFPCQPFSQAGRRKGTSDDRFLWPEMFRVIREFRPRWIVGENVAGLITWSDGLVLRQILADLESAGYEVQAFVIPAVAVNAPHRRDRVWIIAHATSERLAGRKNEGKKKSKKAGASSEGLARRTLWNEIPPADFLGIPHGLSSWLDVALRRIEQKYGSPYEKDNGKNMRLVREALSSPEIQRAFGGLYQIPDTEVLYKALCGLPASPVAERSDAESDKVAKKILHELWNNREAGRASSGWKYRKQSQGEHRNALPSLPHEAALAVAEAWHCVRFACAAYGEKGFSPRGWRNAALKALGNAWVPQVAVEIFKAIKEVDSLTSLY